VVGAIELAVREPLASAIRQVADAVRIGAAADAAITREAMRTAIGRLQDELERRQASASAVERLIHAREEW
jgi:alpha-D-ribose 1-methylphosphonate 5-triphosphate diphosphatase PhnM